MQRIHVSLVALFFSLCVIRPAGADGQAAAEIDQSEDEANRHRLY